MKKISTLVLVALTVLPLYARHLSPEEALSAVLTSAQAKRAALPASCRYSLAWQTSNCNIYAFNREGGGFIIAAGDDDMPVSLIGFSDDGRIDPSDIPPAMEEWLGAFSNASFDLPVRAMRENIPPLLKTNWDQKDPFWLLTPVSDEGDRAVTGCAATAIAQVINTYRYPACGTGLATATFKDSEISLQLDDYPIDWDNICDNYDENSTETQRLAVANLMRVVGMAIKMQYNTTASGTPVADEIRGLINHLGYDRSLRFLRHDFFTNEEWNAMVYEELAAGRPVVYNGFNNFGGHSFVCDGYNGSAGDYFHFNWGWSGMSNGYFLLTDLTPSQQGTGGSSEGYNKNQEAIFHLVPECGTTSRIPVIALYGGFGVKVASLLKSKNAEFCADGPGAYGYEGFYNVDIDPVNVKFGIRAVNEESGEETVIAAQEDSSLYPTARIKTFTVAGSDMPAEGVYTVTPVFLYDNQWHDLYQDATSRRRLTMTITSSRMKFSSENVAGAIRLSEVSTDPDSEYINGKPLHVSAVIHADNADFGGNIVPVLCEGNVIVTHMSPINVSVQAGETKLLEWNEPFADKVSDGEYNFFIVRESDYKGLYGPKKLTVKTENGVEVVVKPTLKPEYYNLEGIKVSHPREGDIYIELRGNTSRIIRF